MKSRVIQIKNGIMNLMSKGLGDIFISSIFNQIIMFLVSVFIVRKFPKEDYGYYTIAYNLYNYIAVFVGCGLHNAVLQFCSEKRCQEEKKAISKFSILVGSVFNVILLFVMPIIAHFFLAMHSKRFFVLMSAWPIVAYIGDYLLIQLRVRRENRTFMKANVYSAILFLVVAIIFTNYWGIEGYIYALYVKYILIIAISIILTFRKNIGKYYETVTLEHKFQGTILKYSIMCCFTNFASSLMMLLDVTCINLFIGDASVVATYKVATQIPAALMFIPSSITVFIFPYFAENNTNIKWIRKNTQKLILCLCTLNGMACAVIYMCAPLIINILWGSRYQDAVQVLRILTVNYLITGTFNMAFGNVMVALKKVNINFIKTVISSGINIILNIVLISKYGSIGAAYATLVVSIFSSVFAGIYFYVWCMQKNNSGVNASPS